MRRKEPVTKYQGTTIRHRRNGTFSVDFWHEGQRRRKVFPTLAEAKTQVDQWRIEAKNQGLAGFSLADRDRVDVTEFRRADAVQELILSIWRRRLTAERDALGSDNPERRVQITYDLKSLRTWREGAAIIEIEMAGHGGAGE